MDFLCPNCSKLNCIELIEKICNNFDPNSGKIERMGDKEYYFECSKCNYRLPEWLLNEECLQYLEYKELTRFRRLYKQME